MKTNARLQQVDAGPLPTNAQLGYSLANALSQHAQHSAAFCYIPAANLDHLQSSVVVHHASSSIIGKNLATFNLALLILQKLEIAMVFALELKLSKTLRGLVYFVLQL